MSVDRRASETPVASVTESLAHRCLNVVRDTEKTDSVDLGCILSVAAVTDAVISNTVAGPVAEISLLNVA